MLQVKYFTLEAYIKLLLTILLIFALKSAKHTLTIGSPRQQINSVKRKLHFSDAQSADTSSLKIWFS